MKKCFFSLFFTFFCFFLFSCRKNKEISVAKSDEVTLRSIFLEKNVLWTDELESEVRKNSQNKIKNIKNGITLTSEVFMLSSEGRDTELYPNLVGFGSVDSSELNESALVILDGFCRTFCNGATTVNESTSISATLSSAADNTATTASENIGTSETKALIVKLQDFIEIKHLYTLLFFLEDVKSIFNTEKNVFTNFFYGKPFITETEYEVPIRFYADNKNVKRLSTDLDTYTRDSIFLDLLVYLNKESDWKINQIQIKNWKVK